MRGFSLNDHDMKPFAGDFVSETDLNNGCVSLIFTLTERLSVSEFSEKHTLCKWISLNGKNKSAGYVRYNLTCTISTVRQT